MKGLIAEVYKGKALTGDYSNGGISTTEWSEKGA